MVTKGTEFSFLRNAYPDVRILRIVGDFLLTYCHFFNWSGPWPLSNSDVFPLVLQQLFMFDVFDKKNVNHGLNILCCFNWGGHSTLYDFFLRMYLTTKNWLDDDLPNPILKTSLSVGEGMFFSYCFSITDIDSGPFMMLKIATFMFRVQTTLTISLFDFVFHMSS